MRRALWRAVFRYNIDKPRTEVFVVDSSPAAALALAAHRPREESTYVLCRSAIERGPEFSQRVLRRARQIQVRGSIGSLWYVLGSKPLEPLNSIRLLEALLPLLERGSRITLATPRSCGSVVFGWVDSLLGQRGGDVDMGIRFYPDISELRRGAALSAGSAQRHCA
jgi:hypothetical protein